MYIYFLVSALLGAIIGWSTNVLAVKLIFRPYKPFRLFRIFTIQGLIPKRRAELALIIGQTVEQELLSREEILTQLNTKDIQEKISKNIIGNIKNRISRFFPPFVPPILKENILTSLETIIQNEVERFFNESFPMLLEELKESIPIAAMIEGKINQLDIGELEKLVLLVAKRELKHIEYLGGLVGLIIGILQGAVLMLLTQ
ncbi:MAG: DUF445 domain-containing protein [Bacillota bacterium]